MPKRVCPTPRPDLGLARDEDVLELATRVEAAFGVVFAEAPGSWTGLGDIETSLVSLFPAAETRGPCATAMAFYALRRALGLPWYAGPRLRLAKLRLGSRDRALVRLERELGLRMPKAVPTRLGRLGTALLLFGLICAFELYEMQSAWWLPWAMMAEGALLRQADLGSFKAATLGDLARDVALLNYGAFAARGADRRPDTIWRALRHIVGRQTGIDPDSLSRETRIRPQS